MAARVAVVKTSPETVLGDYARLLELAELCVHLPPLRPTLAKLNLTWNRYFPGCSSPPWQLDGVARHLIRQGYPESGLRWVENGSITVRPQRGARAHRWPQALRRHGQRFESLMSTDRVPFQPRRRLMILDRLFPDGILLPKLLLGANVLHLPVLKTHGLAIFSGAVKNGWGLVLPGGAHYAHRYVHEVLVDLLIVQREVCGGLFAAVDATVCGDGGGPRLVQPRVENYLLAGADLVAVDAVAATHMGFDPLSIRYLALAHALGLGCADPDEIELVGDDLEGSGGFRWHRTLPEWADTLLDARPLRSVEGVLLGRGRGWVRLLSNLYHDWWYHTVGRPRLETFRTTPWGRLFDQYA